MLGVKLILAASYKTNMKQPKHLFQSTEKKSTSIVVFCKLEQIL